MLQFGVAADIRYELFTAGTVMQRVVVGILAYIWGTTFWTDHLKVRRCHALVLAVIWSNESTF